MDIWLHVLLIVIIGGFFFIDKFVKSFNPMTFVIIFSLLGIFFIMVTDVQIVDYFTYTETVAGNVTTVANEVTNANELGLGPVNLQSFLLLIYIWNLFIGATNLVLGKKDSEKRN